MAKIHLAMSKKHKHTTKLDWPQGSLILYSIKSNHCYTGANIPTTRYAPGQQQTISTASAVTHDL